MNDAERRMIEAEMIRREMTRRVVASRSNTFDRNALPSVTDAFTGPAEDNAAVQRATAAVREATIPRGLSALTGAGHGATLGLSDELNGVVGGVRNVIGGENSVMDAGRGVLANARDRFADGYAQGRDDARDTLDAARAAHPATTTVAEIAGAVAAPVGVAGQALTKMQAARQAAQVGALAGGAYNFNSGEGGFLNRAAEVPKGAIYGAAGGAASVPVANALQNVGRGVARIAQRAKADSATRGVMDRMALRNRAAVALDRQITRAGMTPQDVAEELSAAAAEGQGQYNVADVLGKTGQRRLSGLTRSTPELADDASSMLFQRQIDQADRVSTFLDDAFGQNMTAAQYRDALRAAQKETADVLYDAAREGAKPVDVRGAVDIIDARLRPMLRGGVDLGSTDKTLQRFRQRLTAVTPEQTAAGGPGALRVDLSDFDEVLAVKQDLQDVIGKLARQGEENAVRQLKGLEKALDQALEASSDGYRAANDTFRKFAREIDQIDKGADAATRARRSDNIKDFYERLTPREKAAFRVGYVDKLQAAAEGGPQGTNKVGPLTSSKFTQDAATMAEDPLLLLRRIARENAMTATRNKALGNSVTAEAMNDMANANLDLGVISSLMRGDVLGAGVGAGARALHGLQGAGPATRRAMGHALLATSDEFGGVMKRLMEQQALRKAIGQSSQRFAPARGGLVGALMASD